MKNTYGWLFVVMCGLGLVWILGRDAGSGGQFVGEFSRTLAKLSEDLPAMPADSAARTIFFDDAETRELESLIAQCCVRPATARASATHLPNVVEPDCGGWND